MLVVQEVQQDKSKDFWCKIFQTKEDFVVAICDKELLDKVLNFKEKKIKLKVTKSFYGGAQINESIAVKFLEKATIANLMGEKIVDVATKNGFITKENVIFIDETPHAQFVKILTK